MHTDAHAYPGTVAALNALTGLPGSTVRIYTNGDTSDYHEGILRDRVIQGDRLDAVVIEVDAARVAIRWATVDVLVQVPTSQEPTP